MDAGQDVLEPGEEAGQPSETDLQEQVIQETETPQPKYVTEDQIQQLQDNLSNQIERLVQSRTDKAEDRITRRIEEQVRIAQMAYDQVAKLGPNVPPEVRQAIAKRVLDEEGYQQIPAQGDVESRRVIEDTNRKAAEIDTIMGVTLEEGDPELEMLKQTSPKEYLKSRMAAVTKKAERINQQQPSVQQPVAAPAAPVKQTGSPARAPVIGAGQALGNRAEEIARKLNELYKNPVKNDKEIKSLLKENEQYLPRR